MDMTRFVAIGLLAGWILAGCAGTPAKPKVYWPPPPNPTKYEWIMTFKSEKDFPKSGFQRGFSAVAGEGSQTISGKPMGIAADADGRVYLADYDESAVRVYDFESKTIGLYSKDPVFRFPLGLAFDAEGRFYVVNAGTKTVLVFGPDRRPLLSLGDEKVFQKPSYLAINDKLGRIYVTDPVADKVVVFEKGGKHLFSFGDPGTEPGQLFRPTGIATNPQGEIFVADTMNGRVQVFTAEGQFLRVIGSRGAGPAQFESPRGLALDSEGHVYVSDVRKGVVHIFDREGTPLLFLGGGGETTHPLSFVQPTSLYIDARDRIYITDSFNRRFTVWQYLTPEYLKDYPLDTDALRQIEERAREVEKQMEGGK